MSETETTKWRKVRRFIGGPTGAGVLTAALAVVGVVGSVLSNRLLAALQNPWLPGEELSLPDTLLAGGFWSALLLTAVLFWFRQVELDRARDRVDGQMTEQIDRLDKTSGRLARSTAVFARAALTMPSDEFLARLPSHVGICHDAFVNALRKNDRDGYVAALQFILLTLAEITRSFDGAPQAERYAANVMIPVAVDTLEESEKKTLRGRLIMVDPDASADNFATVLILRTDLSAATDSPKQQPRDSALKPIVLGIPKSSKTINNEWRVLPGAARCFALGQMDLARDCTKIVKHLRRSGQFLDDVLASAKEYFDSEAGRKVQSFVSIPIRSISEPKDQGQSIAAVLNIHREHPFILRSDIRGSSVREVNRSLLPVLEPLLLQVAELLARLSAVESPEQRRTAMLNGGAENGGGLAS